MLNVAKIIEKWPSAEVFADDLGLKYRSHGRVMKVRGRIARQYWPAVVECAQKRHIDGVTLEILEEAHSTAVIGEAEQ